jgi:hypothetical protein
MRTSKRTKKYHYSTATKENKSQQQQKLLLTKTRGNKKEGVDANNINTKQDFCHTS